MVKWVDAVLDDLRPQFSVWVDRNRMDVWDSAESNEQIGDTLCQVQVIEESRDETSALAKVLQELFGHLFDPVRDNLVDVAAKSRVQ